MVKLVVLYVALLKVLEPSTVLSEDLLYTLVTDVLGILLYVLQSGSQIGGAATFSTLLSALDHYGREKSSDNRALQARYSTCHNSSARTSHMILLNHTWSRKDTILAHAQSGN